MWNFFGSSFTFIIFRTIFLQGQISFSKCPGIPADLEIFLSFRCSHRQKPDKLRHFGLHWQLKLHLPRHSSVTFQFGLSTRKLPQSWFCLTKTTTVSMAKKNAKFLSTKINLAIVLQMLWRSPPAWRAGRRLTKRRNLRKCCCLHLAFPLWSEERHLSLFYPFFLFFKIELWKKSTRVDLKCQTLINSRVIGLIRKIKSLEGPKMWRSFELCKVWIEKIEKTDKNCITETCKTLFKEHFIP